MNKGQNEVKTVHSASSNQELIERYAKWATSYETDMIDGLGYTMPQDATQLLERHLSKSARILDAGAGTGLVGKALAEAGYAHIEAMDMSENMLEEARKKQVYSDFHQMVLGNPLGFEDNTFDATTSIGTFTVGHAPARALFELVRITKPGGYILLSLPEHLPKEAEYQSTFEALADGQWTVAEVSQPFTGLPKGDKTLLYQYWLFQITKIA